MPYQKGMFSLRGWALPVLLGWLAASVPLARARDLTKAEELYKRTNFESSLALLDKQATDGPATFLLGRNYFMLGDFKKASAYLEKAAAAEPGNSEYLDWLGRAYGRRAETSNPLMAPGFALKARTAFERAVELDGTNRDALSDLFDYYLSAPGFLGGGYDKAGAVASRMTAVDPSEGYFAEAKLAQKNQQYQTAEQHLRQAVAIAPHEMGHLIALARFLANRGRTGDSDAVFQQAEKINPNAPKLWYARADVLIKQKRNLDEAKTLLQKYVNAPITVDDPPRDKAVRLLKEVGGA
ncbi:MAG TPA: tetratricopeptide repeat protein [Bryobacteraceae bacterium]|jgi:Flp pilus assembly protein TadD|nr:tetratricopeptide repeat protein [Bryobacteraceae bacterium]